MLNDTQPDEPKSLIERQVKKPAPPQSRQQQQGEAAPAQAAAPSTPAQNTAADAAAILNAVDEDEEGVEEAQCPGEFTYESEGEDSGSS